MRDADVVLIGGGPVGMTAALYAARAGLSVIVLEPRRSPVDKACGEGVMPGALVALHQLGVEPVGFDFRGIRYTDGRRSVTADFPGGPGRGVRRTELHQVLRAALDAADIRVLPVAAVGVEQDSSSVRVTLADSRRVLTASYVVAADGLHSPTRRWLGLEAPARGPRRHGLRRHFAVAPWIDRVEVHWAPAGEAYVTPVAEDTVGVALLTGNKGPFEEHLAQFPALAQRLVGVEPASSVLGAGPFAQRVTSRASGRVLLVGDAGGYVDALTGEGLAVGFAQAKMAVRAILAGQPSAYPRLARQVTWRSTALTRGLLLATQPQWGRRATLRAAVALPGVFRGAVSVLSRT
ncbi:NAD(P)/FAD-dependent oxidoreductase [Ornithinimicrobium cryptoxanthini]|uniref:NAD(P)/FAD-dependent oxidoreductase n=1 Tax=Ornithinimicrobium cryptoxanthini TaxID=2934161 RepID=A0ABY4YKT8_9MICO|nr:NAD(P)/FAD-dependent oxidoreductase [Ornithinimicrobium cryptoxanthini]USQ77318.1 NAD(P)/FAD-dependent oxidoreductase [Ornithinimicrobium cryptoxanthini]